MKRFVSAAQRMAEIEEAGVTTNVVDHFGLLYRDADGTYVFYRPGTLSYVQSGNQEDISADQTFMLPMAIVESMS